MVYIHTDHISTTKLKTLSTSRPIPILGASHTLQYDGYQTAYGDHVNIFHDYRC